MTEADWENSTNPAQLLGRVRANARRYDRKLRLLACGVCRTLLAPYLRDPRTLAVIEAAELYADGLVSLADLKAAGRGAWAAYRQLDPASSRGVSETAQHAAHLAVVSGSGAALICMPARYLLGNGLKSPPDASFVEGERRLCDLVREVFGPLSFRAVTVEPEWLTSDVVTLARGIHGDRAFDRLPILADALQDAGCDNDDILNHCRTESVHTRGCWVVDLVLGKQ